MRNALVGLLLVLSVFLSSVSEAAHLTQLCHTGSVREIERALRDGADVNAPDAKGERPLTGALLRTPYNVSVVRMLLRAGAKVDYTDGDGLSPLVLATASGLPLETVELLLRTQASPDLTSPRVNNETALMIAAGHGSPELVSLLLQHGASASARSTDGKTPLDYAKAGKKAENEKLLNEALQKSVSDRSAPPASVADLIPSPASTTPPEPRAQSGVVTAPDGTIRLPEDFGRRTRHVPGQRRQMPPVPTSLENVQVLRAEVGRMVLDVFLLRTLALFIGLAFGFWAGTLVVTRQPMGTGRVLFCATLATAATYLAYYILLTAGMLLFLVGGLVMLSYPFVLIVAYKKILQYVLEDPVTGDAMSPAQQWGTALLSGLYALMGMAVCAKIFLLLRFGYFVLALGSLVSFVGPLFAWHLGPRIVLGTRPKFAPVITCWTAQNVAVSLLSFVLPGPLFLLSVPFVVILVAWLLIPHPWHGTRLPQSRALTVGLLTFGLIVGIAAAVGMLAFMFGYTSEQCLMMFA